MITPYGWNVNVWWEFDPAMLWRTQQALELLQPDRWMDYYCAEPVVHPGYVPTVRSWHLAGEVPADVTTRLRAHPLGETWLLFNEGHFRQQDDITPGMARELTFKFLSLARSMDVDVNWCGPNCAINMDAHANELWNGVQWWREYLKLMRRAGIVRPSYHGVHMYHSTDRAMLTLTWEALRDEWRWQWIGDGPLLITEMCAENQPLDQQIAVMDAAYELYEIGRREGPAGHAGAMGVFWFAAWDGGLWPNSALTEIDPGKRETMRLTPLGRHWLELKNRLNG